MRRAVRAWQAEGLTVGLVPTMGALHEGHLSLVRASVAECDRTVVSIYVNPAQFGEGEDLQEYPRRLDEDCRVAEQNGVDLVFCPTDRVMYPQGHATFVVQERLTEVLEGAFRPTHFRGVLTVVCKLFNIAPADRAYFGQKDFQQTVVVRRMVCDLNIPIRVRVMPTVREEDGLAMSSRNECLTAREREQASCLSRALVEARRVYEGGRTDAGALREAMRAVIAAAPLARPDYVEVVDHETLEPVSEVTDRAVAVLAVRIGRTRLIDNMPFGPSASD
ncbi:MAG: pantoate--beta-alanine ligase [Planctomycetes bacterium SM23_32]|nr:MAG: pantoate--beta-alanine ligase [Planctomycetes bacterium SM23_32]